MININSLPEEIETLEEHVYGEVLADKILEAKRDGLLEEEN